VNGYRLCYGGFRIPYRTGSDAPDFICAHGTDEIENLEKNNHEGSKSTKR